jgi:hypothetical protein
METKLETHGINANTVRAASQSFSDRIQVAAQTRDDSQASDDGLSHL